MIVELILIMIITLISAATLVVLLTTLTFLIPRRIERARQATAATPGRAFIIGLVNFLFFGILATFFSQGGEVGGLIGVLILLALSALAAIGLAGMVVLLRPRIYPVRAAQQKEDASLLKSTLGTAVLLIIGALTPVVGWFVLTPLILLTGLGAGIMALVQRQPGPGPFREPHETL